MPTILCVDDSPRILRLLSSIFHLCGYQVLTAPDSVTALEIADLGGFDLAILDYQLGKNSGILLAKTIKRINPGVPVMLFSGAVPFPTEGLDAIDACVPKGESVDQMLHKVRGLLRLSSQKSRGISQAPAQAGEPRFKSNKTGQSVGEVRKPTNVEQHATLA